MEIDNNLILDLLNNIQQSIKSDEIVRQALFEEAKKRGLLKEIDEIETKGKDK